jgi:protoporphyrinogen oxidase
MNNLKTIKVKNLILGGGITGCAAGQVFEHKKEEYLIIEKNPSAGGMTRSIYLGDTLFDYTGHFLHLSHWGSPSKIPYANLNDEEWQRVDRVSGVRVKDNITPAPFQYNTGYLSEQDLKFCKEEYFNRNANAESSNLTEYFYNNFGKGIAELFLIPYNKKMLGDLNNLSLDSIKRFFPKPNNELITNGFNKIERAVNNDYNSKFWYPIRDGIGLLARGLASNLEIQKFCEVTRIDLEQKIVYTERESFEYENLLSSLPLKDFCVMTQNEELTELSKQLSNNTILALNVLANGKLKDPYDKLHWVYFPEHKYSFHRIGIYSNVPNTAFRNDEIALYIEKAFQGTSIDSIEQLIEELLDDVKKAGILESYDITHIASNLLNCAYVHFTHNHATAISSIKNILNSKNISLMGRYGNWDYISMEDSILTGFDTANKLC